jgi:hypothetical protein
MANTWGNHESEEMSSTPSLRKVLWFNLFVLVAVGLLFYIFYPQGVRQVVFFTCLQNGWYALPWVLIGVLAYKYLRAGRNLDDIIRNTARHRRPIAVFVTLCVVSALWCALVHTTTDYLTFELYAASPARREALMPAAPDSVRYTPYANACTDLGNSISATGEHIEGGYVQPIVTPHTFGYVAPITPSGVLNTFMMKNPGFLYLDDSFAADSDSSKRISRIDQPQEVGLGMEWMDNVELVLAHTDLFTKYDTPHYLALDPKEPRKLTMVVPKIKYGMMWRLPYWGGITVIHANGNVEDLSAEQAKGDLRFKGQWIYPMALARKYVEVQNYGCGWKVLTPFVRVTGKLEVEHLDGDNQFPFLMHGADGKVYLVTATKGEGSARGLFRMYYTDASTGEMSYHEFSSHEVVYGAGATLDRMVNIPNYQWYHKGGKVGDTGSGTMIRVEPVYVVRPKDPKLYWKATITNVSHSGISATVVADASRPDDFLIFTKRAEFEAWLHQRESKASSLPVTQVVAPQTGGSGKFRKELLDQLDVLTAELQKLRQKVESAPATN